MLTRFDGVVNKVSYAMTILGAIGISLIAVLIVLDVAGRNFFDAPVVGTIELVRTSIVAIAFLTIPYAVRTGGHIRTTVLVDRLPQSAGVALTSMSYILGALIFGLIAHACWEPMISAFETSEYLGDGALRVPTAPTWVVIVLASVLSAVECLLKLAAKERATTETLVHE